MQKKLAPRVRRLAALFVGIGVAWLLIGRMLPACRDHPRSDAPATPTDGDSDAHIANQVTHPSPCPVDDAGSCADGQSCALYCSDGATKLGCHAPGATSAGIGDACESVGCREGACIGGFGEAPDPRCLRFCASDADCSGKKCQSVGITINCGAGRTTVTASVCR